MARKNMKKSVAPEETSAGVIGVQANQSRCKRNQKRTAGTSKPEEAAAATPENKSGKQTKRTDAKYNPSWTKRTKKFKPTVEQRKQYERTRAQNMTEEQKQKKHERRMRYSMQRKAKRKCWFGESFYKDFLNDLEDSNARNCMHVDTDNILDESLSLQDLTTFDRFDDVWHV